MVDKPSSVPALSYIIPVLHAGAMQTSTLLDFIAVMAPLYWPLTIIIVIMIFRKNLSTLFSSLTQLRFKGVEAIFSAGLKDVKEDVKEISELQEESTRNTVKESAGEYSLITSPTDVDKYAIPIVHDAPASSVILTWTMLEKELMKTVMKLNISPSGPAHKNSYYQNIDLMIKYANLDVKTHAVFERMYALRNAIVHGQGDATKLPENDVREFISVANMLIVKLKNIVIKNQANNTMERSFDATTQYRDLRGTAKADGYMGGISVQSDLKKLGVPIEDNESLVGITLSLGEIMRPHKVQLPIKPYVYAFFEKGSETHDTDTVPLRVVRLEFETVEDFLRIFKRFEVSLSLFGKMTGRTYTRSNSDEEGYTISPNDLDSLE